MTSSDVYPSSLSNLSEITVRCLLLDLEEIIPPPDSLGLVWDLEEFILEAEFFLLFPISIVFDYDSS